MSGYRDDKGWLRERVEMLELSLAKTTGRAILLREERDALRDELERLTRDPKALARVRSRSAERVAAYAALRVAGALAVGVALLPMLVMAAVVFADGQIGLGLTCAAFPTLIVLGIMVLKLPEIVQAIELRIERRGAARRAAARAAQQVRVAGLEPASSEEVEVEAAPGAARLRPPR